MYKITSLFMSAMVVGLAAASEMPALPTVDVALKGYMEMYQVLLQDAQKAHDHLKTAWAEPALRGISDVQMTRAIKNSLEADAQALNSLLTYLQEDMGVMQKLAAQITSRANAEMQAQVIMNLFDMHNLSLERITQLLSMYIMLSKNITAMSSCALQDPQAWQSVAQTASWYTDLAGRLMQMYGMAQQHVLLLPLMAWPASSTEAPASVGVATKSAQSRLFGR
jgi:hypothetical protein